MLIYQAEYQSEKFGNKANWVRPIGMFLEEVSNHEYRGPRFKYIGK
jgi:hypothetical protein